MTSASFVLYVWIPSHEWLLVSTWPTNPGVPGRLLCRSPAIPTKAPGPRHWAELDSHSNCSFPIWGYFCGTVQISAPNPSEALLLHMPMSEGHCLNQCRALCGTPCPQGKSEAAQEVPGFSEPRISPPPSRPILWEEMTSILGHVFCVYSAISIVCLQVPGPGPAVHISGLPASALRLHPRPGPQATALLPQLHRDHAQRSRRREAGHPGVSASVPGPPLELYHHR